MHVCIYVCMYVCVCVCVCTCKCRNGVSMHWRTCYPNSHCQKATASRRLRWRPWRPGELGWSWSVLLKPPTHPNATARPAARTSTGRASLPVNNHLTNQQLANWYSGTTPLSNPTNQHLASCYSEGTPLSNLPK